MALEHTAAQRFLNHWKSLIVKGLMPSLHDFLGVANPELQPNIIILDVLSAEQVPIRLMGTGLVQTLGRELTKTNSIDIYDSHLKKRVGASCMAMVKQPCGQLTQRMVNTAGGLLVPAFSIALPLSTKTGVGCIAAFTHTSTPFPSDDSIVMVKEISFFEWIDIGAGTPRPLT